jgi:hypothetical protein
MKFLCSQETFETECGRLLPEAIQVFTKDYPFLSIKDHHVYLQWDLPTLFNEQIELFSVDPSLVEDCFMMNQLFGDEMINPELVFILTDLIQDAFDSDPIREDGVFCLTFTEIREWYGDAFDSDMNQLFPNDYPAFKEYLLD